MANIIKFKISLISRIRIWYNKYRQNISKRLKYLEKRSKE